MSHCTAPACEDMPLATYSDVMEECSGVVRSLANLELREANCAIVCQQWTWNGFSLSFSSEPRNLGFKLPFDCLLVFVQNKSKKCLCITDTSHPSSLKTHGMLIWNAWHTMCFQTGLKDCKMDPAEPRLYCRPHRDVWFRTQWEFIAVQDSQETNLM